MASASPFASAPPLVTLISASERPYEHAVAAARTCYSAGGIVSADQVSGVGLDEPKRALRIEQRERLKRFLKGQAFAGGVFVEAFERAVEDDAGARQRVVMVVPHQIEVGDLRAVLLGKPFVERNGQTADAVAICSGVSAMPWP